MFHIDELITNISCGNNDSNSSISTALLVVFGVVETPAAVVFSK